MTKTIQREMHFPHPLKQVWQAITESATLAEWMFPNDFEPRTGHHFTFQVPGKPKNIFDGLTVHSWSNVVELHKIDQSLSPVNNA